MAGEGRGGGKNTVRKKKRDHEGKGLLAVLCAARGQQAPQRRDLRHARHVAPRPAAMKRRRTRGHTVIPPHVGGHFSAPYAYPQRERERERERDRHSDSSSRARLRAEHAVDLTFWRSRRKRGGGGVGAHFPPRQPPASHGCLPSCCCRGRRGGGAGRPGDSPVQPHGHRSRHWRGAAFPKLDLDQVRRGAGAAAGSES